MNSKLNIVNRDARHKQGQRLNSLSNEFICEYSHLSSRERNKMKFLARCRNSARGTFKQYVANKISTTSGNDRQALVNRYVTDIDRTPLDRTLNGEIKRVFSGDTLKQLYTGDKSALNASCAKRKKN